MMTFLARVSRGLVVILNLYSDFYSVIRVDGLDSSNKASLRILDYSRKYGRVLSNGLG
jgi:hypothetical protein